MIAHGCQSTSELAGILREYLDRGYSVQVEGLGEFRCESKGRYRFRPETGPRVFIAYVEEDLRVARRLYRLLSGRGFRPWLDKEKLKPGQNWPRAIERAITISDFVVTCFSSRAVLKRGHFQAELRYALDCANRSPLDAVYLIPVRLDECKLPLAIQKRFQYVDLFPDFEAGGEQVIAAMRPNQASRFSGVPSRSA